MLNQIGFNRKGEAGLSLGETGLAVCKRVP